MNVLKRKFKYLGELEYKAFRKTKYDFDNIFIPYFSYLVLDMTNG